MTDGLTWWLLLSGDSIRWIFISSATAVGNLSWQVRSSGLLYCFWPKSAALAARVSFYWIWYSWNLMDILRVILKYFCKQCSEHMAFSGFTSLLVKSFNTVQKTNFCVYCRFQEILKLFYLIRFWHFCSHILSVRLLVAFSGAQVSFLFWKSSCPTCAWMSPVRPDFLSTDSDFRQQPEAAGTALPIESRDGEPV